MSVSDSLYLETLEEGLFRRVEMSTGTGASVQNETRRHSTDDDSAEVSTGLEDAPNEVGSRPVVILFPGATVAEQEGELWDSVTSQTSASRKALYESERLFRHARAWDEMFEEDTDSQFSRDLMRLLEKYGGIALRTIEYLILTDKVNAAIAAETLEQIGLIENPFSHTKRRRLLERCLLASGDPRIRDAALVGISYLDNPASLPCLRTAVTREVAPELRRQIQRLLTLMEASSLENRDSGSRSSED